MSDWVVEEFVPDQRPEAMDVEPQGGSGGGGGPPPVLVRNGEELLAFIQKRNPAVVTFEHEGRTVVRFDDFYMAVCGVSETAARSAKSRLMTKDKELCERVVKIVKTGSELDTIII
jgi:hypothetical protein